MYQVRALQFDMSVYRVCIVPCLRETTKQSGRATYKSICHGRGMGRVILLLCLLSTLLPVVKGVITQPQLDYMSKYVELKYGVVTNLNSDDRFVGRITLKNTGTSIVQGNEWSLYFSHMRVVEPDTQPNPQGTSLGNSGLKVYHVNGYLHRIAPAESSFSISAGASVTAEFNSSWWQVSRTDVLPNWYLTAPGLEPRVIVNTADDDLHFVEPFDTEAKWKRITSDKYNPFTAEERYARYEGTEDKMAAVKHIIPTPLQSSLSDSNRLLIKKDDWVIVNMGSLSTEATYLADKTGLPILTTNPASRYISLTTGTVPIGSEPEAYTLEVKADPDHVIITGTSASGVFYGIQSLLSLMVDTRGVPVGTIQDKPRFPYRGMHLDVGRNFRSKAEVMLLLDAMAMYKLNKFHFHITDDEGWRLEIPGLQELTEIGGKRCHDLEERTCISSQIGSGPGSSNSGSGFYTVQDYRDLLKYADDRHIQVIPEFDMPGHGHAAIKAMEARYHKLKDTNMTEAGRYLLSDLNDTSEYLSVQAFTDNSINPCIDSTYEFISRLIVEVKKIHEGTQMLPIFNFGGDEVAEHAWKNSPACIAYSHQEWNGTVDNARLKKRFVERVGKLVADLGLDLAGWEDGLKNSQGAYDPVDLHVNTSYAYVWNNIWEWQGAPAAYNLANAGHKVILAHATHLYFDHPQEPDPEERGLYWAPRFTDTPKVLRYMPDDVYANIDYSRMGEPLTKDGVCIINGKDICVNLTMPHNIIGMQGHLWSEVIRNEMNMHEMIFPRLLALAERAWHKASWENITDAAARKTEQDKEWTDFANTLGYKELNRLESMGISYNIPVPGARVNGANLQWHSSIPGLKVHTEASDGHVRSESGVGERKLDCGVKSVKLHTRTPSLSRSSREVTLDVTIPGCVEPTTSQGSNLRVSAGFLALISLIYVHISVLTCVS